MPEMFVQQVSLIAALSLRQPTVPNNYLMQCGSLPLLLPLATGDRTGDEQSNQAEPSRIFRL